MPNEVFICGAIRTPIGSFMGSLASVKASRLGAIAIKALMDRCGLSVDSVQEVLMGNVLQAGMGQAPAKQAALYAGLSTSTPCTTVNKVCASGLKAIMLGAQSIMCDSNDVVIAGGMESMSNVPFMMGRNAPTYGGLQLKDGILHDALTDPYNDIHMGKCVEMTVEKMKISRVAQDDYALNSYKRSADAWAHNVFANEVCPVDMSASITDVSKSRKSKSDDENLVVQDEEFGRVNHERFTSLRTVFQKDGTITAGNASTLNDGAAAVLLMSNSILEWKFNDIKPLAQIQHFCDAACEPVDFALAPVLAINKLMKETCLTDADVTLYEINEAFSAVVLACSQQLKLDLSKVNVHGGAVSLGHPVGMSGARLIVHLVHSLQSGQRGVAAICNGGGGASAMLIRKL